MSRKRPLPNDMSQTGAPPAKFSVSGVPGSSDPTGAFFGVPGAEMIPGAPFTNQQALALISDAGRVQDVSGFPSQEVLVHSYISKPWDNQYHLRQGRGQVLFLSRNSNTGNDLETIASLPQLNEILRKAHKIAQSTGILERRNLDYETFSDLRADIAEDLEDELDKKRRQLDEGNQDDARRQNVLTRIKNVNEQYWTKVEEYTKLLSSEKATQFLKYQTLNGILEQWNYIGVLRNLESTEAQFKVLNVAFKGPLDVDNYWEDDVRQGLYAKLILKRYYNSAANEYQYFQFHPWIQPLRDDNRVQTKYPSSPELYYEDIAGYAQYGAAITVGKIGRVMYSKKDRRTSSQRLVGLEDTPRTELEAHREHLSPAKSQIFMSLGGDDWDTASL